MSEQSLNNSNIEKKPQGQAVAGMVLGIVGLLFSFFAWCIWYLSLPLTLVGVILSGLAIKKCSEGIAAGKGMAIAGLVTSIVGLVWTVIAMMFWIAWGAAAATALDAIDDYDYDYNYNYNYNDWEQEYNKAMDEFEKALDDYDYNYDYYSY